jgi:TonB family protein
MRRFHCASAALALVVASCGEPSSKPQAKVDTTLPAEKQDVAVVPTMSDADTAAAAAASAQDAAATAAAAANEAAAVYDAGREDAVPGPIRPSVVTNPYWIRRPSAEDVARYYPDRAQRMELEGHATLSCQVDARGTLNSCEVVEESPESAGFGDAAMRLSKLFKMQPMMRDGAPVDGGTVRVPLDFRLPKG